MQPVSGQHDDLDVIVRRGAVEVLVLLIGHALALLVTLRLARQHNARDTVRRCLVADRLVSHRFLPGCGSALRQL